MRRSPYLALILGLLLVLPACANEAASQAAVNPETEDQKTLYALGLIIAQQLGTLALTEEELTYVQAGMTDSILGSEAKVKLEEYGPKVQQLAQARMAAATDREKAAGAEFQAAEAAKEGAEKTASGLVYQELVAGEGASPAATDTVTVHYTGTLRDGTVFDSSVDRGQPATFRLNQVIPCWTEGVQKLKPGGKARLVCPAEIAYGDQGAPPRIPPGATLIFEVELISVQAGTPPPAPPAPPASEEGSGNEGGNG